MSYAHQLLCIYLFSIMHPTLPTSISNNIVSETGFTNSRMTSNKAQINECENVNCCLHPLEILLYRCIFFFFVNIELFMPVLTRSSGNDCNSCIIRGFKYFFSFVYHVFLSHHWKRRQCHQNYTKLRTPHSLVSFISSCSHVPQLCSNTNHKTTVVGDAFDT